MSEPFRGHFDHDEHTPTEDQSFCHGCEGYCAAGSPCWCCQARFDGERITDLRVEIDRLVAERQAVLDATDDWYLANNEDGDELYADVRAALGVTEEGD